MSRGTRGAENRANMDPPPPPPPPNPAELMQMMVESQRLLTETINQMANQGGRNAQNGPTPNQYRSFKDFIDTKPPSFREAEEPLQAEEWLNTVEQKIRLLWLTDSLKVEYAAHQLQGQLVSGGISIGRLFRTTLWLTGISSVKLSRVISYLLGSWK